MSCMNEISITKSITCFSTLLFSIIEKNEWPNFQFDSNVNLWVKIHLTYEEMFSRILIKLRSHLTCSVHVLAFLNMTMWNCFKISMLKICVSFLTHSRESFSCSKKEISIGPHVWSIKMIKLGNYFFLKIDYCTNCEKTQ